MSLLQSINNPTIKGLYVPAPFDAKTLLNYEGYCNRYINSQSDKYNYFLHLIHYLRVSNPTYQKDDFIRIDRTTFENTVGKRYAQHILDLMIKKWKFVESDGISSYGKAFGYRFTKEFASTFEKVIMVDIINEKFEAKLAKVRKDRTSKLDEPTQYIGYHLTNIGIHAGPAKAFIKSTYEIYDEFHPKYIEAQEALTSYYNSVDRLNQGVSINDTYYHINRDKIGNRVFNNITTIKKTLRPYIFLKDCPDAKIYSIDVSAFQPYAFCKLLKDYYKNRPTPVDVQQYYDLCRGSLYSQLIDLWKLRESGLSEYEARTKAKKDLLKKVFFCKNIHSNNKQSNAFKEAFPNVYTVICHFKKKDYKKLAHLLQRLESSIMIDDVALTLARKYKHTKWFLTIHDCILCTDELIGEVQALITGCCTKVVGFAPKLNAPEWINTECLKLNGDIKVCNSTDQTNNRLEQLNIRLSELQTMSKLTDDEDEYDLDIDEDGHPKLKLKPKFLRKKVNLGFYSFESAEDRYHNRMHIH